jgi:hypothetical protein
MIAAVKTSQIRGMRFRNQFILCPLQSGRPRFFVFIGMGAICLNRVAT